MRNVRYQQKHKSKAGSNRENIYGNFDYRKAYFEKNRGIFGYLYICSQCLLPMAGQSTISVDHIMPPSRFARKKRKMFKDTGIRKATLLSTALNNTFNCVTICKKCNSSKGNKIDHRVLKGITAKFIELGLKATQFGLSASLYLSLYLIRAPFAGAGWVLKRKKKNRRYHR